MSVLGLFVWLSDIDSFAEFALDVSYEVYVEDIVQAIVCVHLLLLSHALLDVGCEAGSGGSKAASLRWERPVERQ